VQSRRPLLARSVDQLELTPEGQTALAG
jgi:hypothetical protein